MKQMEMEIEKELKKRISDETINDEPINQQGDRVTHKTCKT
jgi:hypothetical protein